MTAIITPYFPLSRRQVDWWLEHARWWKNKRPWAVLVFGLVTREKKRLIDILKGILLKENYFGLIKTSIKFVAKNPEGKLTLVRVPNRQKAIDWNKDDKVHWCI